VDTNNPSRFSISVSRPVQVGELVIMVDYGEGEENPFCGWGRVREVYPDTGDGFYAHMDEVTDGWAYVPFTDLPSSAQDSTDQSTTLGPE
jgi:hypothetical protein